MRVGVSGMVATGVDVAALVLLVELFRSHVTIAAFLAATLGGVTNFLINKYWAFDDEAPLEVRQITIYALVALVTAAFTAAAIHILAVLIGVPYLIAKAIAAALVFLIWTYPAQARLVFPDAPAFDEAGESMPELALDSLD
jgi:putative flippase GtrA